MQIAMRVGLAAIIAVSASLGAALPKQGDLAGLEGPEAGGDSEVAGPSQLRVVLQNAGSLESDQVVAGTQVSKDFSCPSAGADQYTVGPNSAASDFWFNGQGADGPSPNEEAGDGDEGWKDWIMDAGADGINRLKNTAFGGEPDDMESLPLSIRNFSLSAVTAAGAPGGLKVYSDPPLEGDTLNFFEVLRVAYVCSTAETFDVKLEGMYQGGTPLCLRWKKICQGSWNGFRITEVGSGKTVAEDGVVNPGWATPAVDGEDPTSAAFLLSHPGHEGSVRLISASITSSNPAFLVSLRGRMADVKGADAQDVIQVDESDEEQISVVYECKEKVSADLTMTVTNESPLLEPIVVKWTAACSPASATRLTVSAESCSVKAPADQRLAKTVILDKGTSPVADGVKLSVAPHDDCTVFSLSREDGVPIKIFPKPQLQYHRKSVFVPNKGSNIERGLDNSVRLKVQYTCLDDSKSQMHLTVHMQSMNSQDLIWEKLCTKPRVHTDSSYVTGRSVLGVSMFLFLSAFLIFLIGRSKSILNFICRPLLGKLLYPVTSEERHTLSALPT